MAKLRFDKPQFRNRCDFDRIALPAIIVGRIKYDYGYDIYIEIAFWKWAIGLTLECE
jgi:hypothetical protein